MARSDRVLQRHQHEAPITATIHITGIGYTTPTGYPHVSTSSRRLTHWQTMDIIEPSNFNRGRDKSLGNRSAPRGTARRDTKRQSGQLELTTGVKLFDIFITPRVQAVLLALLSIGQDCSWPS